MPQADLEGNVYTPSGVVSTTSPASQVPAWTPSASVSTGSSGLPSASNPGMVYDNPVFTPVKLSDTIQQALLNDPNFKQQTEWNTEDTKLALDRLAEDKKFYEQNYQLALQQLKSSGGGGSSGEAQAAALDALAKEQAAHQKKLSEEQLREVMASRGMASSGQLPFEQGELQYNYQNLLKEIDLRAEARRAAAASAASAASSARANQLASMQLQYAQDMVKFGRNEQDIKSGAARQAGSILMSSGEKLAAAWWNADTSEYEGPGGERWDKFGNPVGAAGTTVSNGVYSPVGITTNTSAGAPMAGVGANGLPMGF